MIPLRTILSGMLVAPLMAGFGSSGSAQTRAPAPLNPRVANVVSGVELRSTPSSKITSGFTFLWDAPPGVDPTSSFGFKTSPGCSASPPSPIKVTPGVTTYSTRLRCGCGIPGPNTAFANGLAYKPTVQTLGAVNAKGQQIQPNSPTVAPNPSSVSIACKLK